MRVKTIKYQCHDLQVIFWKPTGATDQYLVISSSFSCRFSLDL